MAAAKKEKAKEGAEEVKEAPAPIIIKKIQGDEAAGHGGAWKIALADMMTAMMAFFLLMWLLGASTEAQRKSIADYFKPTPKSLIQSGQLAGSNGILGGRSIMDPEGMPNAASQTSILDLTPPSQNEGEQGAGKGPEDSEKEGKGADNDTGQGKGKEAETEQGKGKAAEALNEEQKKAAAEALDKQNFEKLEKELREKIADSSMLAGLQGQLQISREKDGLRIEVIDKADFSMFALGTTKMLPRAQALIDEIARSVATMPNKVTVRGHTDSVPFANPDGRNNWSLSAERAEAMRLILEKRGVKPDRFQSIEGVADTDPFNSADKSDPRNRRISVTLKFSQ
jgi:chemotaxis protein MotB